MIVVMRRLLFLPCLFFLSLPTAAAGASQFSLSTPRGQSLGRPAGVSRDDSPLKAAWAFVGQHQGLRAQGSDLVNDQQIHFSDRTRVRFNQTVDGIPVWGADTVVLVGRDNRILYASGARTAHPQNLDARPQISAKVAAAKAQAATRGKVQGQPSLLFYDPQLIGSPETQVSLVWRVEVQDKQEKHMVLVDAKSGQIRLKMNLRQNALYRRVCEIDQLSNPDSFGDTLCTDDLASRIEGGPASSNREVNLAYQTSGAVYQFFHDRFGRDSLDGHGMPLVSVVGMQEPNAFFDSYTGQMTYGTGFVQADDVAAHELTHGVTSYTSNLNYIFQSGAINEAMSDIMGELFDQSWNDNGGNDSPGVRWQLGEDLPARVGVIRDMKDPTRYGQPDRTSSDYWVTDEGYDDGGGVHTNSGVANKAAYLLADGDSFNGYQIDGIGAAKTARLFYNVDTQFLRAGSDYRDLAKAMQAACSSLPEVFSSADCQQVDMAILATQMDQIPQVSNLPRVQTCANDNNPSQILFDDNFNPIADSNWISGGPGLDGWQATANFSSDGWALQGGERGGRDKDYRENRLTLAQPILIQPGSYLKLRHYPHFLNLPEGNTFEGGVVEWSADRGKSWHDIQTLSGAQPRGGYDGRISKGSSFHVPTGPLDGRRAFVGYGLGPQDSRWNLSSLQGKQILLRLRRASVKLNDLGLGNPDRFAWTVDGLTVYSCAADQQPTDTQSNLDGPLPRASLDKSKYPKYWFPAINKKGGLLQMYLKSDQPGTHFVCRTDSFAAWESCNSPVSVRVEHEGISRLQVRVMDDYGRIGPVKPFMIWADWTPPRIRVEHPQQSKIKSGFFQINSLVVNEMVSGFFCQWDSGPIVHCDSEWFSTNKTMDDRIHTITAPRLRWPGTHRLRLWAEDFLTRNRSKPMAFWVKNDLGPPKISLRRLSGKAPRIFIRLDEPARTWCRLERGGKRGSWRNCNRIWQGRHLRPGGYRLWVKARNMLGRWNYTHLDFRAG